MTQDTSKGGAAGEKKEVNTNDQQKNKEKREKNYPPTKVVIRRLPPSMTMEVFMDQIAPVPDHDYMYFVKADMSLGQYAFSRAYINFTNQEDIFLFKDKFDGYVFVDQKGNEFPAIVEFAPFQKIPKKKIKKKDTKCGTIEQDLDYIKFLETLNNPEEVNLPSAEFYLEEIENRERELRANNGVPQTTTPLIEYLKQKKAEKLRIREEKREERKRRELEKKRIKEEERRRRKAEKEKEKEREKVKEKSKDGRDKEKFSDDKSKEAPVKLLKNPEREKEKGKDGEKDGLGRNESGKDTVGGNETDDVREKTRKESGDKTHRGTNSAREKDWEIERRRRDEERQKHKDKARDRRDRDKYKREREEHTSKPSYGKTSHGRSGSEGYGTTSEDRPRTVQTSHSSEWHRDRHIRKNTTVPTPQSSTHKSGNERMRGGKSYEKTRESIAKARSESKNGGISGSAAKADEILVPITPSEDMEDKSMSVTDLSSNNANSEPFEATVDYIEGEHYKSKDDNYSSRDDDDKMHEPDLEDCHESKGHKERSSRDPRSERRIRNKDRPSMELYRPGMRRLSLQRNSPQKESPSSSSSPSPTAQMLEKQMRGDSGMLGEAQLVTSKNSQDSQEGEKISVDGCNIVSGEEAEEHLPPEIDDENFN